MCEHCGTRLVANGSQSLFKDSSVETSNSPVFHPNSFLNRWCSSQSDSMRILSASHPHDHNLGTHHAQKSNEEIERVLQALARNQQPVSIVKETKGKKQTKLKPKIVTTENNSCFLKSSSSQRLPSYKQRKEHILSAKSRVIIFTIERLDF